MNAHTVTSLLGLLVASVVGAAGKPPAWLDTQPPTVRVEPAARYHRSVFLAVFTPSEPATVYVSRNSPSAFATCVKPLDVSDEGRTVLYYYAVDDVGNRGVTDSVVYIIDRSNPELSISPPPGTYPSAVQVRITASKPCRIFLHRGASDTAGRAISGTLTVSDSLSGYVTAVDSAGNRVTQGPLGWTVASAKMDLSVTPPGGTFNRPTRFSLRSTPPGRLYYTFDDQALPDAFSPYRGPTLLPYGQALLRFYAIDAHEWKSAISQAVFVIDTVPPELHIRHAEGLLFDTLFLVARGAERVYYALGGAVPSDQGNVYRGPITIRREGRGRLRAFAVDAAGNASAVVSWEATYDHTPPTLSLSSSGGIFSKSCRVMAQANKPSNIYYTLDGSAPDERALLYRTEIVISRQGVTLLRAMAVDEAGNRSVEQSVTFTVDTIPPVVRPMIEARPADGAYLVSLTVDEDCRIFYTTNENAPASTAALYEQPVSLKPGQVLRYFAIDRAGNRSAMQTMDDLRKPMVSALPAGGVYNYPVHVGFATTVPCVVYWRMLPDTAFVASSDSIRLDVGGQYSLEYYCRSQGGSVSPVRRNEYTVDLSPPRVRVTLRKGVGDTALVLFDGNENMTVYYTLDGTSPANSPTARTAGNKYLLASDRIKVVRRPDAHLAYYAEDAAGNQSRLALVDLFKPHPVPSLPDGPDIVYDRVLSVELNTFDEGRIYYARHGHIPTVDSTVYAEPLTLGRSDTICAFVIDVSGTMGAVDTFVYLIDLPPTARFSVMPAADSIPVGEPARLDASGTSDPETPLAELMFRWDYEGDGVFDTPFGSSPVATHAFARPGVFRPLVEAMDSRKRVGSFSLQVAVRDRCPAGMVSVVTPERHFCIDRYEWPDTAGKQPTAGHSWVQAKMACLDAGKRLCSAAEWQAACYGREKLPYPYGIDYQKKRCPTEGTHVYASGAFAQCGEGYGLHDMVGNLWEWVEDKRGDAPLQVGGSYRLGGVANCGLVTEGTVAARSQDVGFRCCK